MEFFQIIIHSDGFELRIVKNFNSNQNIHMHAMGKARDSQ